MAISDLPGQGWYQFGELTLAFVLSGLVGLEREIRQKSAGLRTYSLVGVAAALFMLVSKYGFTDVLANERVVLDPSRVAAQIVSGIGFIGGGVIFMRRDVVRGLTTAASLWVTAAVGMACGAGLLALAVAATIGHFVIMLGIPLLLRYLPRERRTVATLRVSYDDGKGILRAILVDCSRLRFAIDHVRIGHNGQYEEVPEAIRDQADDEGTDLSPRAPAGVTLSMQVKGKRPISHLISSLSDIPGVTAVGTVGHDELD
ncbi:MgtC/SapB transporter [Gluconacetobacter diazotrophicus PA1 5]|nr:MgtC/SapB family protein [Gluconacetobacter diazotrophicus]ACI52603.1 MgtC/SapB transporter [Gluconacetobacter diazotrophicus PA1 5]TWB03142.1 putative Mg2+ transporter-C (MgtC) family protein [Gluconacetobacter diazotrophicus]